MRFIIGEVPGLEIPGLFLIITYLIIGYGWLTVYKYKRIAGGHKDLIANYSEKTRITIQVVMLVFWPITMVGLGLFWVGSTVARFIEGKVQL